MLEFVVDTVQSTKHQTVSRAPIPGTAMSFTLVEYFDSDGGSVNLHFGGENIPYDSKPLAVFAASVAAQAVSVAMGLH